MNQSRRSDTAISCALFASPLISPCIGILRGILLELKSRNLESKEGNLKNESKRFIGWY